MPKPFDTFIEDQGDLVNAIVRERTDVCPYCNAQRIELFSFNQYPQYYKEAIDAAMMGYTVEYNKYEIRLMKCRSCNHEFVIDWTSGFPIPLRDTYKTNRFFAEFAEGH